MPYTTYRVGGPNAAAAQLIDVLTTGTPAITVPDRQIVGYWYLNEHFNGHGGH